MSLEVFPTLNERLYLCSLYGKNVNPELDISLGKPLSPMSMKTISIFLPTAQRRDASIWVRRMTKKGIEHEVDIFAEDKPAEKVFVYKLEVADHVLLLSTAMLSGAIALASLCSALKD